MRDSGKLRANGIRLKKLLLRFVREVDGPTATEYAFCLALMIMVSIAAIAALGTKTSSLFPDLAGVM